MENLPNDHLIGAYIKAIELQLDKDFELLLKEEIRRRGIEVDNLLDVIYED
ncbi:sporulation histidine kinase inhibitor Sda [Pseudogracilibacillus sp. SE30717A]|uniref:sporulation histidine kinase inhibitor Sda n=1 Tax=Pseudogracilibacillus sp. SE30717A TaxID=3098293 RepID=UPI00300DEE63